MPKLCAWVWCTSLGICWVLIILNTELCVQSKFGLSFIVFISVSMWYRPNKMLMQEWDGSWRTHRTQSSHFYLLPAAGILHFHLGPLWFAPDSFRTGVAYSVNGLAGFKSCSGLLLPDLFKLLFSWAPRSQSSNHTWIQAAIWKWRDVTSP